LKRPAAAGTADERPVRTPCKADARSAEEFGHAEIGTGHGRATA
jgi:hypothetical protein